MSKQYYIYILTNHKKTVLYTGVTNDLIRRIYEHKNKLVEGFTKKYHVSNLVYYEITKNVESAIAREKFIKGKTRKYKDDLIDSFNPGWKDLYNSLIG